MATRRKRKLAALKKENCQEHPRSSLAQNSNVPRSQEDYISQDSEKVEGRITKKLSHEFGRKENRIIGALARLDGFLMNPLIQGHFGTARETCPGTHFVLSRERRSTTPRVVLILKQASSTTRRHKTLAQKITTTVPVAGCCL